MNEIFGSVIDFGLLVGERSIAYSFGYRSEKGTMKQKEIDTAHDKLRAHLQKSLPVTFR
ncbi:hypothetical protein N9294_00525 [bacterium]|nr:hypothetical protein [bacterium]